MVCSGVQYIIQSVSMCSHYNVKAKIGRKIIIKKGWHDGRRHKQTLNFEANISQLAGAAFLTTQFPDRDAWRNHITSPFTGDNIVMRGRARRVGLKSSKIATVCKTGAYRRCRLANARYRAAIYYSFPLQITARRVP